MPSVRRLALPLVVALVVSGGPAGGLAADGNRARKADEQREDAAVREARDNVAEAERGVREALQSLQRSQVAFRKAEADRRSAGVALQKTVDRLEDEHADADGLVSARTQLKEARARFKEAAQPVLAAVTALPAYRAAEEERSAASALLEPEAEGDREDAARRAARAATTMRDMERDATAAKPHLVALEQEIATAEKRVEAAKDRFEKAVERDPELRAARRDFETARAAEERAEAALVKDNRDLIAARSTLARAQQSLAAKRAADQKDSNKPPRKKAGK